MATQYTSILKLALPVQGELSGTWGDAVNDQVTSMIEEAIAGLKTINTWVGNSATLSTADGATSESRAAILNLTDTTSDLSGAATLICPAASKIYIVKNATGQQVTVRTASGTGIAIPNGTTGFVFCDGTNVVEAINNVTGNLNVGGHASIGGNLTVTGTTTFNGGTLTLGDANTDNIVFGGEVDSNIIPDDDDTHDLGSSNKQWKDIYIDGVAYLDAIDFNGTAISSTAAELNIMDGDTSATSTTLADADRVVVNDAGTMKQVALTDFETYFESVLDTLSNVTTVGALNAGSITSGFGTIDTGDSTITTTGLITGGSLDIDDVVINGSTIGHTDDTDLITVANGIATVAGEISVTTLDIGGTNVTSTAAELNIVDGGTSATSTTLADADRVVVNDNGTMVQVALTDFETYFESALDTLSNVTTVGALNDGSITSGFGTIDTGSSAITTTGLITGGSLDIDDVVINGTTIGHTDDTDLITLADGVVTVAGEVDTVSLDVSGNIDVDGTTNLDNTDIDGTLVVDGSNISLDSTSTLNIDNSNTSNGITIGTATSGVPISIGHTTSEVTVNDNLTVTGDLTVSGTTTTVNSTVVNLNDHNIVLDSGNSTSGIVNGAGITIEGGSGDDATFTYNTSSDQFELKLGSSHENLQVDQLIAASMSLDGSAITTTATLSTGISNGNVFVATSGIADNDFLKVDGTSIEGRSSSEVLSDIGGQASLTFGISNTNAVKIDSSSVADDEYARFTANGLESRSTSEVLSDIGGQASLTFGISNTNAVKIDSSSVADDEYARFTANGLESRSASETRGDIGLGTAAVLDTGISNTNVPKFTSGVADNDFLRVDGTAIEGRSASEVLSDIGGQASLTFGISNTNAVKIDHASVADDDFARFTSNGLEGRSSSEVLSDIGATTATLAAAEATALAIALG